MDTQHQLTHKQLSLSRGVGFSSSLVVTAAVVAVLSAAILSAAGDFRGAVIVSAAVSGAAFLVSTNVPVEAILVTWFVTTPLASFFIRFPIDRSILTYNRLVFGLLVIMLLLKRTPEITGPGTAIGLSNSSGPAGRLSFSMTKFEGAWALLSLSALASAAAMSDNTAYATRLAIDAFWLPLIAFHIARKHFDLRRTGRALLLGGVSLAVLLFAIGAIEFASGSDLFHYKGSEIIREGERRINGPFAADSSYAIICLMLLLLLLAARKQMRVRFDRTGKLVYAVALASAALGAMLPLFRSIAAALIVSWIVLRFGDRLRQKDGWRISFRFLVFRPATLGPAMLVLILLTIGAAAMFAPSIGVGRLSNPRTVFGRLATWRAAAALALVNPVFGVGLGNYSEYFRTRHFYRDKLIQDVFDARAADSPHSNVLWIGAELGVIGLALYLAANILLFLMGWRALGRASGARQHRAASSFLALLLAYWIPGLALASGQYSDLNLYFFFFLGALSSQFSLPSKIRRKSE